MLSRAPVALLVAFLGLAAVLTASSAARARELRSVPALAPAGPSATPAPRPALRAPSGPRPARAASPAPPRYRLVRIRSEHSVALRSAPGGSRLGSARARTEFGSPRVLLSTRRSGRWLGVVATERPNGRLAWIDGRSTALANGGTSLSLHADLSRRRVELRSRGRVKSTFRVAVGRPGSSTPTGRFSVTDKLSGSRFGPYYGCCVLALSGHQPNTPVGWTGGDRLAIHGTDAPGSIGSASSAGCLRAADRDLKRLMRRVPLGTPVIVSR